MVTSRHKKLASQIILRLIRRGEPASATEDDDLSYETALLNLEVRSFLHSEYDGQEPPPDSFQQLMRTIESRDEATHSGRDFATRAKQYLAQSRTSFRRSIGTFSGTMARSGVTRLVSSGLVAMLVVAVMWPRIAESLNAGAPSFSGSSVPARQSKFLGDPVSLAIAQAASNGSEQPTGHPPFSVGTASQTDTSPRSVSPGLEYDQPRVWLQQHMGEYLDSSTQVQSSPQSESTQPRNRSGTGSQAEGDGGTTLSCAPSQLCPR